ncbi:hypothetical protein BDF19DRAFT_435455 [Syncephalis fuscata]|nr:hypothetical protein BDF19DRAFT_435455 [Syncephalis fuscata]
MKMIGKHNINTCGTLIWLARRGIARTSWRSPGLRGLNGYTATYHKYNSVLREYNTTATNNNTNVDGTTRSESNVSSISVVNQPRLNGRRRRYRILTSGGSDNNNNNDNNDHSTNTSHLLTNPLQYNISTHDKDYSRLALPITEEVIQQCFISKSANYPSPIPDSPLISNTFCKELTLMLEAALRQRTGSEVSASTTNKESSSWYTKVAYDLDANICQLDAWTLQELFDPLLPLSDTKWPVYPRRAYNDRLEMEEDNDEEMYLEENSKRTTIDNRHAINPTPYYSPYFFKDAEQYHEQLLDNPLTTTRVSIPSLTPKMDDLITQIKDRMTATFHQLFTKLASKSAQDTPTPKPLLIHVTEAIDLSCTYVGQIALFAILRAIQYARRDGVQVALVVSCGDSLTFPAHFDLSAPLNGHPGIWDAFIPVRVPMPKVSVPLTVEEIADSTTATTTAAVLNEEQLTKIHFQRIKRLNIRNMQRMLRKRGVLSALDNVEDLTDYLMGEIWPYDYTTRVINTAVGLAQQQQRQSLTDTNTSSKTDQLLVTDKHVSKAISDIVCPDLQNSIFDSDLFTTDEEEAEDKGLWQTLASQRHAQQLQRAKFNTYERRLLNCLVDPGSMKGSFKNVIAASSTIRALQTLISLPLLYPNHFAHGVLSDHALTGILLFGPPGTGKTLLAKAVAAESGATMLEIKGSDIYDKYVGESEKNVQAIFSMARKMSPCVIFIDEVDALFNSRGSDGVSSGKRETVNQFMAEWDGLRSGVDNRGITVLCATNRPFDLDDAVLRRMPRRILVDLPSVHDRQRILDKHLVNEQLGEGVTTAALAHKTPLYSGSDLKNVCVTAALAALREQVTGTATGEEHELLDFNLLLQMRMQKQKQHDNDSESKEEEEKEEIKDDDKEDKRKEDQLHNPTGRIILQKHFDLALREIAPSSSEEMQTLTELRRWDRLYGDGGNLARRRAFKGFGFGANHDGEHQAISAPAINL